MRLRQDRSYVGGSGGVGGLARDQRGARRGGGGEVADPGRQPAGVFEEALRGWPGRGEPPLKHNLL